MPKPKPKKVKHPWRACPLGEYFRNASKVKEHFRRKRRVRAHFRKGCCAINPTKKDQIYQEEMIAISRREFKRLTGAPSPNNLSYANGNNYDHLIRGWTQYWNAVLNLNPPLDANLIKALIATESGFRSNAETKTKSTDKRAYGLLQVLGSTLKILKDEKGEIKDHYINVSLKNLKDPSLNIAIGIRWLARKLEIAKNSDKKADWIDAVAKYKSYPRTHSEIKRFLALYETLSEKKND